MWCLAQTTYFACRYAYATNARFTKIIAFQFITSTFVVCSNLYQLTRITLSANFFGLLAYTFCVLVQIFIYCWFGNKLKVIVCTFILFLNYYGNVYTYRHSYARARIYACESIRKIMSMLKFINLQSLQLVDNIFEIEWIVLDNKTKKSLLIIMNRAMRPIEFISAHIFNMNLDSFVAVSTVYTVYI